ncbi:N-acetylmuramoyl-L-alanine amidase [Gymnodinialimonas phycosphaerae]|nr:N-acetylmuramoyl-L-alanine amidase [Gymnodinialimonas phycosphaerae]
MHRPRPSRRYPPLKASPLKSQNFGERRDGLRPELVVIHYTAMKDCAAAAKALCDPLRQVSAHYLIGRDGEVFNLVPEAMRAWHAGAGEWRGRGDVNSRSIGIELDNDGLSPFSEPLLTALETLLGSRLLADWGIGPEGVIGHSDMAPGRKIDPGRRFDWQRLARQGLAVWSEATGKAVDAARFRTDALAFGYPDVEADLLLEIVRMRFRPWAHGPLDGDDCAVMADLAARYGYGS